MFRKILFLPLLTMTMACGLFSPVAPAAEEPAPTPESKPAETATQPETADEATLFYISGTIHIETNRQTWPDVDAFLAFLQQATDLGMRWSVGADVGWLEGETRAAEVIQKTEAMGVQWDIHTHNLQERAKAAYLITQMGGHPTSVYSGFLIDEFEAFVPEASHQGVSWSPQVLWGAVSCPGHRPGCDEQSAGLWSPANGTSYLTHDTNSTLVHVGGGTHQLNDARALAQSITNNEYSQPIISFTVMVAPVALQIVRTNDGFAEITTFVNEMNQYTFVRWATIEETAQAWVAAGRIPSRVETK